MKQKNKINLAKSDQCTGCTACVSICPTNSITMCVDKEGFLQPHINADTCIKCHKCEKTCPVITPIAIPTDFETQVYAAIDKDEEVRMRSSSGGVFYALAKWTIDQGGVVFGARFDENWDVVHDYTETIEGIEPFMRSKYVQSRIGDTYKQTKQFLKEGRKVLFVGTPCQIGGLRVFLWKDYENLLTMDFICHGVPSPGVWRKYLKEKVKGDKVLGINFRDKKDGWRDFQCVTTTTTTTTTTTREQQHENLFMGGFLDNLYLRKSCYQCQYKKEHRISDITMADYWGVWDTEPKMYDKNGVSALLIHTNKGYKIWSSLSQLFIYQKQEVKQVEQYNSMLTKSVELTNKRRKFYLLYPWISFEKLSFIASRKWMIEKIIKRTRKLINKIYRHHARKSKYNNTSI